MNDEGELELTLIEELVGAASKILNHDSFVTSLRRAVEVFFLIFSAKQSEFLFKLAYSSSSVFFWCNQETLDLER